MTPSDFTSAPSSPPFEPHPAHANASARTNSDDINFFISSPLLFHTHCMLCYLLQQSVRLPFMPQPMLFATTLSIHEFFNKSIGFFHFLTQDRLWRFLDFDHTAYTIMPTHAAANDHNRSKAVGGSFPNSWRCEPTRIFCMPIWSRR